MAIQVLSKEEMNEVSGGLLVQVGANASTPILGLDLNIGNLLATVTGLVGGVLSTVTSLVGGLLGFATGLLGAVTSLV